MKKKKNLKDTITTVCGVVGAIAGVIVLAPAAGIPIAAGVLVYAKLTGLAAGAIISYFIGKNPDGTKKTPEQIDNQLNPK